MDNQPHNAAGILGAVIEKFVSPDDNTTLSFIKAMMVKQKRKNLRKMQLFGNSEQLHQTKKISYYLVYTMKQAIQIALP